MKATSNISPESYTDLGKKGYFNFNIQELTDDEGQVYYSYEFVEVESLTRDAIIRALIALKYTVESEIGILNDYIANGTSAAYTEYQEYRNNCITIADTGEGSIEDYVVI